MSRHLKADKYTTAKYIIINNTNKLYVMIMYYK